MRGDGNHLDDFKFKRDKVEEGVGETITQQMVPHVVGPSSASLRSILHFLESHTGADESTNTKKIFDGTEGWKP